VGGGTRSHWRTNKVFDCQWLAETFHLTPADARSKNNFALQQAALGGHLEVCQWLVETFALTAEDMCGVVVLTYGHRRREVLDWIATRFGSK
jgi:hypothetical protein